MKLLRIYRCEVSWCIILAIDHNILLVGESSEEVKNKLKEQKEALIGKGVKISKSETNYMFDFGKRIKGQKDINSIGMYVEKNMGGGSLKKCIVRWRLS